MEDKILDIRGENSMGRGRLNTWHQLEKALISYKRPDVKHVDESPKRSRRTEC